MSNIKSRLMMAGLLPAETSFMLVTGNKVINMKDIRTPVVGIGWHKIENMIGAEGGD
jgi:hypothetical protein